ncbi:hypothetical protein B0T24DRAFT_613033 [Lasiosphaeria ovina]|uniref:Uncharacterized protein n=1 Tax=Lasiosphaeria ovina TaxID=92902 RepID=A0AAE0NE58_9PEZI|nr:hypothetical protein B0T24DRAFT_613033 [Lasiosphaeria ovina]
MKVGTKNAGTIPRHKTPALPAARLPTAAPAHVASASQSTDTLPYRSITYPMHTSSPCKAHPTKQIPVGPAGRSHQARQNRGSIQHVWRGEACRRGANWSFCPDNNRPEPHAHLALFPLLAAIPGKGRQGKTAETARGGVAQLPVCAPEGCVPYVCATFPLVRKTGGKKKHTELCPLGLCVPADNTVLGTRAASFASFRLFSSPRAGEVNMGETAASEQTDGSRGQGERKHKGHLCLLAVADPTKTGRFVFVSVLVRLSPVWACCV